MDVSAFTGRAIWSTTFQDVAFLAGRTRWKSSVARDGATQALELAPGTQLCTTACRHDRRRPIRCEIGSRHVSRGLAPAHCSGAVGRMNIAVKMPPRRLGLANVVGVSCTAGPAWLRHSGAAVATNHVRRTVWRPPTAVTPSRSRRSRQLGCRAEAGP